MGWEPAGISLIQNEGWSGTQTFSVVFPMRVRLYMGFNYCVAIERGPLVYALPIAADWRKIRDRQNLHFDDWEVYPRVGLELCTRGRPVAPGPAVSCSRNGLSVASPFSTTEPPVFARVKGRRILSWGFEKGAAAPPAASSVTSREPLEDIDADSLWLHRPANHRVPDPGQLLRRWNPGWRRRLNEDPREARV